LPDHRKRGTSDRHVSYLTCFDRAVPLCATAILFLPTIWLMTCHLNREERSLTHAKCGSSRSVRNDIMVNLFLSKDCVNKLLSVVNRFINPLLIRRRVKNTRRVGAS
jgi:hypothetical protein